MLKLQDFLFASHDAAEAAGLIAPEVGVKLKATLHGAYHRSKMVTQTAANERFDALVDEVKPLAAGDCKPMQGFAGMLSLDTIIASAYHNGLRKATTPAPKERMKRFIEEGIAAYGDSFVEQTQKGLQDMVLRLVHTMHPTIYTTPESRTLERDLTELFEACTESGTGELSQTALNDAMPKFQEKIKSFMDNLKPRGRARDGVVSITPVKRVTVTQETDLELENLVKMRKELDDMLDQWNDAVTDLNLAEKLQITPEMKARIVKLCTWGRGADADGRELATSILLYKSIEDEIEKNPSVTGADGKKHYTGTTFDLRQNANLHRDFFSALVQAKYFESTEGQYNEDKPNPKNGKNFSDFCFDFMQTAKNTRKKDMLQEKIENSASKDKIREMISNARMLNLPVDQLENMLASMEGIRVPQLNPRKSIFQELKPAERANFVKELIKADYQLVPDGFRRQVTDFNPKYRKLYHDLTHDPVYEPLIRKKGFDPDTIDFKQLRKVALPGDMEHGNLQVKLESKVEDLKVKNAKGNDVRGGFRLTSAGLGYQYLHSNRLSNFLSDRYHLVNGRRVRLTQEYRTTLMDTIKRLIVVDDAIGKYGSELADRHQLANFSEEADFYIAMKLFKEAGLITINKENQVTNVKVGIMPLVETIEDMKQAKEVFENLLKDPLALSYFKTRGQADIMLGFSDGAASAGNFASQWEIYKVMEQMSDLFAKEGIKLCVFEGRGRGGDRGGTIDPALSRQLLPENVKKLARVDVTLQSDLPTDLANSEPYGHDYFTSMMLGALDARMKAVTLSDTEKAKIKALEPGIDLVASLAALEYTKVVRTNGGALAFISSMFDNEERSSRNAKRKEDFDSIRAITKEHSFNSADLPAHNVGLKEALQLIASSNAKGLNEICKQVKAEFEKMGQKIDDINIGSMVDANGQQMDGPAILKALNDHPYFHNIMKSVLTSARHYDPAVANGYKQAFAAIGDAGTKEGDLGKKAANFIDRVSQSLNDLARVINDITGAELRSKGGERPRTEPREAIQPLARRHLPVRADQDIPTALDQVAHAAQIACLKVHKNAHPDPDDDRVLDRSMRSLTHAIVREIGIRSLPSTHQELGRAA